MAKIHIPYDVLEGLAEKFEEFELKVIGSGKHEELHRKLEEVKEDIFGSGKILDVRDIPPAERHPLIFSEFDNLEPSESFILINDHNPKPLYYEFQAEKGGKFLWEYIIEGPIIWCVKITKTK